MTGPQEVFVRDNHTVITPIKYFYSHSTFVINRWAPLLAYLHESLLFGVRRVNFSRSRNVTIEIKSKNTYDYRITKNDRKIYYGSCRNIKEILKFTSLK